MNLTTLFILLSMANVVLSTIRSLTTIKSGKWVASLVNAFYYGYYTIVAIYTVTLDFAIWQKVVITFGCNFVGVFFVKLVEEKMRKDKLWKVELTVLESKTNDLAEMIYRAKIPFNFITTELGVYTIFNVYCATQEQSLAIKELAKQFNAKYFASESKTL